MSLSDEERSIVVELEMEKAHVAYNETIWLMEKESWSSRSSLLCFIPRRKRIAYSWASSCQ